MPIAVKEVIQTAARLVGLGDLATETEGPSSEELLLFLRCFNLVENEVALDYFPLKCTETLTAEDGKIKYTSFSKAPVFIARVTDHGAELPFEAFPAYLDLKGFCGIAAVTYAYAPAAKEIGGAAEFEGRVSCRLLAYGTAAEFLLACGKFSEAAVFDKKYREALTAAGAPRKKLSVRARRWA